MKTPFGSRCVGALGIIGSLALAAACGSSSGDDTVTAGADAGDAGTGADSDVTADSGDLDGASGDSTSTTDGPAGCGTCPTGTTCGSANGIAVCRSASGIPVFTHVFVIVMENTSLDTLDSASNAPYLAGLKAAWATGADYHGAAAVHPSLPNYIAMTSGGSQGITCDCNPTGKACTTCNAFSNNCGCNRAVPHLGDQIETAKKTWKAYGESMGTPCNLTGSGDYAPKHIPFLYYDNVQTPASRCSSHVVDYNGFAADLAGATPDFSFIAPNLVDDMHGTGFIQSSSDIAAGDTWLATHAKAILESPAFKSGGLFVIVWDEDDHSGIPNADDPIPVFVMSPYAKTKFRSTVHADHYSLLATIEDGLLLPRLGLAATATPLTDYFPAK